MTNQPTAAALFSPPIRSLIPLLYVAWSDRVLGPSEIRFLKERAAKLPELSESDRALIEKWTDPRRPPSREQIKLWEVEMHRSRHELPPDSRRSLVDLGLQMARQSVQPINGATTSWVSPQTRKALEELEELLGLIQLETYHRIFPETEEPHVREVHRARFPVEEMRQRMAGSHPAIRRQVETLLRDPVFARVPGRDKEAYRQTVLEWVRILASHGFGALAYPKAYGGTGDMSTYGAVFETLAFFDLSLTIKFGVQFGLFGGSIEGLGTEKHHRQYLDRVGSLELPGCFAMTETGHGSNVRGLETTATYDPATETFVVHTPDYESGKEYIGNALHGRMATVFCQLITRGENHGVHALLVPLRDEAGATLPGIRIEDNGYKLGLNGVDNGRIWFDQVRVPRENLLNRFGDVTPDGAYDSPIQDPGRRFFTMLGTLVGGRVFVPRAGLNAAKAGLTIAVRYALRRRQFGAPHQAAETLLLDYPSHQRRLMPLLAKAYALQFALDQLQTEYLIHREGDMREVESLAAGLKAYATWFTTATLQECREACGGKGYLVENRLADLKADTDIFTTFEGDNTVLMQLVARSLLTHFQQAFSEEGVLGVLRFLGGNMATNIRERNPIIVRTTDRAHLLDPDFHLKALEFRENRLLFTVGQRLRTLIKNGSPAYEAYLQCQTHLLQLAEAFVERYILQQFQAQLAATPDGEVKAALTRVYRLFALHTLERHKGWYLEKGYMEGAKTRAVRRLVDEHCGAVRQDAYGLVQAFGIPDDLLGAEIIQTR